MFPRNVALLEPSAHALTATFYSVSSRLAAFGSRPPSWPSNLNWRSSVAKRADSGETIG